MVCLTHTVTGLDIPWAAGALRGGELDLLGFELLAEAQHLFQSRCLSVVWVGE